MLLNAATTQTLTFRLKVFIEQNYIPIYCRYLQSKTTFCAVSKYQTLEWLLDGVAVVIICLHTLQCEYEHIRRKPAVANISGLARSAQYSGQQLTWNIARLLLLQLGRFVKLPAEAVLSFSPNFQWFFRLLAILKNILTINYTPVVPLGLDKHLLFSPRRSDDRAPGNWRLAKIFYPKNDHRPSAPLHEALNLEYSGTENY